MGTELLFLLTKLVLQQNSYTSFVIFKAAYKETCIND